MSLPQGAKGRKEEGRRQEEEEEEDIRYCRSRGWSVGMPGLASTLPGIMVAISSPPRKLVHFLTRHFLVGEEVCGHPQEEEEEGYEEDMEE